ncbi:hypothetical protein OG393_32670 (plasmid) [Streptomyces sp. NBC_01216]|uniref:hypothetical protein n=1 Tax=Streptomyces sp. NBC_01216 TaxID=2903778 RepID=UPI002E12C752|nr:hypothetical protein OG393_32670 [Streptomyces sp. NBC_01216]
MNTSAPATVMVHAKAARTAVHDLTLTFSLPEGASADPAAIRRYIEDLQPGVRSAACTDATLDQVTDVVLVDVLGIEPSTHGGDAGVRDDR